MLSAIRRAWRSYLDSLPRSEEPAPVSDAAIRRDMNPPHPAEVRQAFAALAGIATRHLPQEAAAKASAALSARLKPGTKQASVTFAIASTGPEASSSASAPRSGATASRVSLGPYRQYRSGAGGGQTLRV